jgi:hypothetical protein
MAQIGIFHYDRSMEWLWPVIDRIESLGYEVVISRRGIQIWEYKAGRRSSATDLIIDEDFEEDYAGEQKRISIWDSCVSFIDWYNSKIT